MPRLLSGTLDDGKASCLYNSRPQSSLRVMRPKRKVVDSENEQIYQGLCGLWRL